MKKILFIFSIYCFFMQAGKLMGQSVIADTTYAQNEDSGWTKVVWYRNAATTTAIPPTRLNDSTDAIRATTNSLQASKLATNGDGSGLTGLTKSQVGLGNVTNNAQLTIANNLSDLNNAATARTNMGGTTVGINIFTLTNPSAIRFLKINADNTVTARTAAEMLADIGGQASGSYVTVGGAGGTPSSITLTNGTGLPIGGLTGLGSNVGTFLATPSSANFFAAITDETGSGKAVGQTNPVLVGPTIGISGTAASSHITTVGSAPTVAQTGLGSGGSVGIALETGSTDQAGIITLTTGNASVGSTGTITLTFNSAYVTNQPVIVLTLVKGATDWGVLGTIRQTTQSLTAPIFTWNNSATGAAVALTANTTYKVAYMVIQK